MVRHQIYLDYAAATPLDDRVILAMKPYMTDRFYNPSAMYGAARDTRDAFENARHEIAKTIGAKQHEVIITAGATESINLALSGITGAYGGEIVTSPIEHLAVTETAKMYSTKFVAVTSEGLVTAEAVAQAITPTTTIVSIGYINNELGTVQPLHDIADIIEKERQRRFAQGETLPIWFHTDASQAAGLLDISVSRLGVDMITLNAGKCYGPKQVGMLWVRGGIKLTPIIHGGTQESSLRGGTENVMGAVGFATALKIAVDERKTESHRIARLRDMLQRNLEECIDDLVVNGHHKRCAPHILHVSVPGLDGERAVFALDDHGVMAATGSACAANKGTRSHVLTAVEMSDVLADGSLRFSLGRQTSESDIERASEIIAAVIAKERAI